MHLFTVLKMISLCVNCSTAKKGKKKNTRKTHRLMSSVGEKAGLFKLLLCLAFLFFGLLKQVNIAVESKTIGVIFPPFLVIFCSGWAKILKQKSLSSHSLSEKEKWVWKVWNFLRKPALFFFPTPYLARAHVCRRFVFNPCPHEATMFKDKRGRTIHKLRVLTFE